MNNADTNGNSPAQPIFDNEGCGDIGLTKREHFAGLAMQGMVSNHEFLKALKSSGRGDADNLVALASLEMADALLATLDNQQQGEG